MRNSLFRRSLVFGIIILFIGVGIVPSMSGYTEKTSNQSTEEAPTNFPLNNDYVNAYWKFDEGSGNILEDSSGHDYDGTIYGATWTTGHSGYALDFDGVNDYVDLDIHSENLGFNKTDDLIFSVYFNTTSTDAGCIYSLSHHWVGNYPEAHIELTSNGNIKVQVWVGTCGLALTSEDTHNDGSWHHAEIFYHGTTCNPTVEIYVDDDPDGSITDWVCSFSNDEFERAKIGRKARDATEYFDGVIDKLKIIKYGGGNQQVPPNISGPTSGDPGVEYDYTFITEDPEEDEIRLWINWSDGTYENWIGPYESGEEVIVSHTWSDDGSYDITARSKDRWHQSRLSDPYVVKIGNQPPDKPTIDGPQYGDVEEELTYTFVAADPDGDNITYYIDWGDGDTEWTDYYASGEEATATHAWDSKDVYEITAKAKDTLDNEGDWSDPFLVSIGDQPPDAPDIDGPTSGSPGVKYNYTFVTTDPEGDDVYYWIEWFEDDPSAKWEGPYASGEEITRNHTWDEKGTYTIRAKAKDSWGYEGDWGTLKVTIPKNQQSYNSQSLILKLLQRYFGYHTGISITQTIVRAESIY